MPPRAHWTCSSGCSNSIHASGSAWMRRCGIHGSRPCTTRRPNPWLKVWRMEEGRALCLGRLLERGLAHVCFVQYKFKGTRPLSPFSLLRPSFDPQGRSSLISKIRNWTSRPCAGWCSTKFPGTGLANRDFAPLGAVSGSLPTPTRVRDRQCTKHNQVCTWSYRRRAAL